MQAAAELRRIRYLQAMGIEVFVSRRDLPAARAIPRLGVRDSRHREPLPEAPVLMPPLAKPRLPDLPATSPAVTRVPAAREPERPAETFSLTAVIACGHLWLEDLDGAALAKEQLQLVAAIGRALIHPQVDNGQPRVAQFDWPLHRNPQLDLGAQAAAEALAGFLQRQVADHQIGGIMCLGDGAARRVKSLPLSVVVTDLPSSRTLLESPQRKRDLWHRLKR